MRVKDIIKKQTTIIAIAVVLVAMTAMGASYAIFFDIKKNQDDQVITAGTLKVTISGVSKLTEPKVLDNDSGLKETGISYTIENKDSDGNSNLPNNYTLYIYADDANTMDLSKVKVATNGEAKVFNALDVSPITISSTDDSGCTSTSDGKCKGYKIDSGTLQTGDTGKVTKSVKVWIDESLVTDEIESKTLSLKLYIVSEVAEQS